MTPASEGGPEVRPSAGAAPDRRDLRDRRDGASLPEAVSMNNPTFE